MFFVEIWNQDMNVEITTQIFSEIDQAYAFIMRMKDIIDHYKLVYFVCDELDSDKYFATNS